MMKKTLNIFKTVIAVYVSLILMNTAKAQQSTPLWSTAIDYKINWIKVTPLGQLIACSNKGIMGFDIATGKQIWMIEEIKNCPVEMYTTIDNSPLISLVGSSGMTYSSDLSGGEANLMKERLFIFNPINGKVLFNSSLNGMKDANERYYLNKLGKVLMFGKPLEGKTTLAMMVDLNQGKVLWTKENKFKFTTNVIELPNEEILITSASFIIKLNAVTGEEIWKKPIDPLYSASVKMLEKLEKFAPNGPEDKLAKIYFPPTAPDICIVGVQKQMESTSSGMGQPTKTETVYAAHFSAFNIKTGAYVWNDKGTTVFDYPLGVCFPTEKGLLVGSSNSGHFSIIDYTTGKFTLGKKKIGFIMPDFKGELYSISYLKDSKILLQGKKGNKTWVNIYDEVAGKLVFDRSQDIKGTVKYVQEVDKGLLVGTREGLNLLNIVDGSWIFETKMSINPHLVANVKDQIYLFNLEDEMMYKFPKSSDAIPIAVSSPAKFQGKEKANHLEIVGEDFIISSEQNMLRLSFDGKVKFQSYYPAPKNSILVNILLTSARLAASYAISELTIAADVFVYSRGLARYNMVENFGNEESIKRTTANFEAMGGLDLFNKRFKNTTNLESVQILVTEEEQKTLNDALIKKISKEDGLAKVAIPIGRDVTPIYDIDLFEGKLYYLKNSKTLEAYKF
jgi:outer membrane protein assembly factor BamB